MADHELYLHSFDNSEAIFELKCTHENPDGCPAAILFGVGEPRLNGEVHAKVADLDVEWSDSGPEYRIVE